MSTSNVYQLSFNDLSTCVSTTYTPTKSQAEIFQFPTSVSPKQPHTQQRVSPIRDPELVNKIFTALRSSGRYGLRNATIFALQCVIGRRTNDMLRLTIQDIYDFKLNRVKDSIKVDEHKTGKTIRDLRITSKTQSLLQEYLSTLKIFTPTSLLFPSQKETN